MSAAGPRIPVGYQGESNGHPLREEKRETTHRLLFMMGMPGGKFNPDVFPSRQWGMSDAGQCAEDPRQYLLCAIRNHL
jgi:hypothetical protein